MTQTVSGLVVTKGATTMTSVKLVEGRAPTFTVDSPPTTATVGELYQYTFGAGGQPTTMVYSLAQGAPSWLSINAGTGTVSGTPPSGTGTFSYQVIAANTVAPDATTALFDVSVSGVAPTAPTLSAGSLTFTAGTSGSVSFSSTGAPTPTLSEAGTLPAGLTFSGSNGAGTATIAGTPTGAAGTYPITVTASNGVSPAATTSFTLHVVQAGLAGQGYWLVASDGGIFSFGDAKFHGSTGTDLSTSRLSAWPSIPTASGYWLVASDGGIFSFGDAKFYGSTGDTDPQQADRGHGLDPRWPRLLAGGLRRRDLQLR